MALYARVGGGNREIFFPAYSEYSDVPAGASVPSTPTASVTKVGLTSATLQLTASSFGGLPTVTWTVQAEVGGAVSYYSGTLGEAHVIALTGLTAGGLYTFRVQLGNLAGASDFSAPVTAQLEAQELSPPTNLAVSDITTNSAVVRWTHNSANEGLDFTYSVQYRPSSGGAWTSRTVGATVNELALSGLSEGTSYSVRVCATGTDGESDYATENFTTLEYASLPGQLSVEFSTESWSSFSYMSIDSKTRTVTAYGYSCNGVETLPGSSTLRFWVKSSAKLPRGTLIGITVPSAPMSGLNCGILVIEGISRLILESGPNQYILPETITANTKSPLMEIQSIPSGTAFQIAFEYAGSGAGYVQLLYK